MYTKKRGKCNKEILPELKDLLSDMTEEEQGKVIDVIKIIFERDAEADGQQKTVFCALGTRFSAQFNE